jgi:nucleotide-binding universal stress UspA family protein
MKTILTPVDFSSATSRVVEAALELARAVEGRIVLLHVVQPPIVTSDYGLAMENVQEILAVSEKAAARQLSHLLDSLKAKGVEARVVQINGAAVSGILDSAAKLDADYIVMGSHGHTALYDLLVGSTTHGVLKKTPCPVLIVPPTKKKGAKKRR